MGVEIIVPVALFSMVVVVVWLIMYFGAKKQAEAFQTMRLAIEKGQEAPPGVMEAMMRVGGPLADLRKGIMFLAIAGAFAAMAGIIGGEEPGAVRPLLGVGVFPLFVGLAFLGLHIFANDKKHG